jgi:hypothetical protein
MGIENIIFAAICGFCALIFGLIALWAFKRRTPMHFWAGSTVKPEEIADISAYNKANGKLWLGYTIGMIISGVVSLFSIGAGAILLTIICVPGVAVLIVVYKRIYEKYKKL